METTVNTRIALLCTVLLCLCSSVLFSGTTGKIAGKVRDASTGQPLPGANIVLTNTTLGASSDGDGYYVILNIPPGEYVIVVSSVGYATVRIKVKVVVDLTTTQDIALSEQAIVTDAVVITAERTMIQVDRTNTAASIESDQIKAYPVQDIGELVQLQAGVVRDADGGFHIRGGRNYEITYMIDGVPVSDQFLRKGGSIVELDKGNIDFLQVISGTFNAEYGQSQSGIINIVSGSPKQHYAASATMYTGSYYTTGKTFLALNSFRPSNERNIEGSLSGPVPGVPSLGLYAFARFNKDNGFLFGQRLTVPQDAFPVAAYREWFQREFSNTSAAINNAIPIPDSLLTGDRAFVPMNGREKISFNAKLSYQLSQDIRTTYSIFTEDEKGSEYDDRYRYNPDGLPNVRHESFTHILNLNHVLADNLFYVVNVSYLKRISDRYLHENVIDSRYETVSPEVGRFAIGGTVLGKLFFRTEKLLTKADLTWQMNAHNMIKFGVEAAQHRLRYHEIMPEIVEQKLPPPPVGLSFAEYLAISRQRQNTLVLPTLTSSGETGYNDQFYDHQPIEMALYAQDKVELDELIINFGARFEYFDPDHVVLEKPEVSPAAGSVSLLSASPARRSKPTFQLSPRLGVAFPISDQGVIHVSYGHFRKLPPFEYMYQNSQFKVAGSNDSRYTVGNAELKPQTTSTYELGLQQQVSEDFGVDATLFYSDFRNLLGLEIVRQLGNVSSYLKRVNRDYGNNWGFTLAVKKRPSGLVSATMDYTLMVGNGNESDPNNIAIARGATSGGFIRESEKQVIPLDWDQRHSFNGTLTLSEPADWTVSCIGRFATGQPYTPQPILLDVNTKFKNTERKPLQWSVDINASKSLQLFGIATVLFVRVFNVFDVVNETSVHPETGQAGNDYRFPSVVEYEQTQLVGLFTLRDIDLHQDWYAPPRRIQLGVTFNY
ncbi:MAG: hypothetical protein A3C56_07110 [Ignavibacteria bacterium RIFCSPHIGHO2_02_FULL_56_12]|nr:MAG: hypothetical protein A3C56_07110 [Ignavibacteria bacterium RIFCSPHIGHO2_02_FULL_56_12]